jgi:hypothetical protein
MAEEALAEVARLIYEKPRECFGDFFTIPALGIPLDLFCRFSEERANRFEPILSHKMAPLPNIIFKGVAVYPKVIDG